MLFIQHYGVPGGIRTPDLLVRSQSLYPAELPAHTNKIYQLIQLLTKYPQVDLVFRSQSLYPAELQAHYPLTIIIISQLFLIVNTFFRKRNILYFLRKLNKIYMQIAET